MKKIWAAGVLVAAAGAAGYLYLDAASRRSGDDGMVRGTVRAVTSVQVRSAIAGEVKEIAADFKTSVKSGQILARIDAAAFQQRVNQARADVEAARAAKAATVVRQREALLRQAELDLERTVIRAPVDGTVILRNATVGQTVAAGASAPALFAIAPDLGTVLVEAVLSDAQARRLQPGMKATFSVDALPRRAFSGEIREVRKGKTHTVLIAAANADRALLPGMTANVRMPPAP